MIDYPPPNMEKEAGNEVSHALNPKVVFGFLLLFGIFTLMFGGVKIWKDIRGPFFVQESGTSTLQDIAKAGVPVAQSEEELRAKDTDTDALSDWDELNRYGTSPYLKDSDGDSYDDKMEIDTNNDPNCPRGQNCRMGASLPQGAAPSPPFSELLPPEPSGADAAPPDYANLTAPQLRELMLKNGGVTQEQLDLIDDATLMQMYQETLSQQQQQIQQQR